MASIDSDTTFSKFKLGADFQAKTSLTSNDIIGIMA